MYQYNWSNFEEKTFECRKLKEFKVVRLKNEVIEFEARVEAKSENM